MTTTAVTRSEVLQQIEDLLQGKGLTRAEFIEDGLSGDLTDDELRDAWIMTKFLLLPAA